MMLHSAAADMPRGLRKRFPGRGNALGRGDPVQTRTRTGWDGRERALSGLGLTDAEITAALVAGAGPGTPAYEARYGAGGTYLREPSVIATYGDANADHIADVHLDASGDWVADNPNLTAPPAGAPPVNLYVAMQCGPSDAACIAENERRQLANLRIIENANRAFNLQVCRYNASLNPAAVNVNDCTGLYSALPVLTASGEMRTVSPSGGEYSTPIGGETAAQLQARTQAWTAQQTASATTNQPNQSVPPRPQPGEVPTGGGITAAELAAILAAQNKQTDSGSGFSLVDADGKILGLDPKVLMLIAAGVGVLMLLKK